MAVGQHQSVFHGRAVRRRHLGGQRGGEAARFVKHSVTGLSCAADREAPCEIITLSCRTRVPYTGVLREFDLGSRPDGVFAPVIPGHHDGQTGPMQGTSIPWTVASRGQSSGITACCERLRWQVVLVNVSVQGS